MVHFNRLKPAPGSLDQCDDLLPDKTIPKESTPVESNNEDDDAEDMVFTYPGSEDIQTTPLDTSTMAPSRETEPAPNEVPPPGALAPLEDRPVPAPLR